MPLGRFQERVEEQFVELPVPPIMEEIMGSIQPLFFECVQERIAELTVDCPTLPIVMGIMKIQEHVVHDGTESAKSFITGSEDKDGNTTEGRCVPSVCRVCRVLVRPVAWQCQQLPKLRRRVQTSLRNLRG